MESVWVWVKTMPNNLKSLTCSEIAPFRRGRVVCPGSTKGKQGKLCWRGCCGDIQEICGRCLGWLQMCCTDVYTAHEDVNDGFPQAAQPANQASHMHIPNPANVHYTASNITDWSGWKVSIYFSKQWAYLHRTPKKPLQHSKEVNSHQDNKAGIISRGMSQNALDILYWYKSKGDRTYLTFVLRCIPCASKQ